MSRVSGYGLVLFAAVTVGLLVLCAADVVAGWVLRWVDRRWREEAER